MSDQIPAKGGQLHLQEPTPCELCGTPTLMLWTKRCDRCWELERRIHNAPELAAKILKDHLASPEALERELALANARIDYLMSPDSSQPEGGTRDDGLEEAARACEFLAHHCDRREAEGSTIHAATTLRDAAGNIRAVKNKPSTTPVSLAKAVLAYDAALDACGNDPKKMATFCTAQGDNLDKLYFAMVHAAQAALNQTPPQIAKGSE